MEISWSNINSSLLIIIMVGRRSFQAATSGMVTGRLVVALARVWVSCRRICTLKRPWQAAKTPHHVALQEIDASRPRGPTSPHFHSERPQWNHFTATTISSTKSKISSTDSLKNSKTPESRLQQAIFLKFIQIRS